MLPKTAQGYGRWSAKEPLINYTRRAFLSRKPQIVRFVPRDSSTATAEAESVRDAAFSTKPGWDGPLRVLPSISAHSLGITQPRSPKLDRSTRKDSVAPAHN